MKNIKIAVYCASSSKCRTEFLDAAFDFGKLAGLYGFDIIYGGGKAGLMGKLADGALSVGAHVEGIIPEFMVDLELEHKGVHIIRVDDMHQRQSIMEFDSDCCIALPGGSGTLLELLESISFKRLGLITSPIIIVNLNHYFDPLLKMLQRSIEEKFMSEDHHLLWHVTNDIEETIEYLKGLFPKQLINSKKLYVDAYISMLSTKTFRK